MESSLSNYGKADYDGVTRTWDIVQHEVNIYKAQAYYKIQLNCYNRMEYTGSIGNKCFYFG